MLAAVVVNLVTVLPLFLTGGMAVQIGREFGVNPATAAFLASLFALMSMLGSAPLSRWIRVWGIQRSLRLSAGIGIFALVAAAGSQSIYMLGAAMLIAGIGNALGQPAGNALVASQIRPERFGLGFAIKQSAIPLATTAGGLAVPLLALTVGWRVAYLSAVLLALLGIWLAPPNRQVSAGREEAAVPRAYVLPLWTLALGMTGAVFAATSIGALGTAGGVAVGLSESTAGYLVAVGGLAGLTIRLVAGVLADKRSFDSLLGVSALMVIGGLGWLAMAWQVPATFVIGLIVANAFGWGWPGLQHLSIARRFPTSTAAASGVSQTGIASGLLLGPLVLGVIATSAGWGPTWIAAAAAAFAGAIIVRFAASRIPVEPVPSVVAARAEASQER